MTPRQTPPNTPPASIALLRVDLADRGYDIQVGTGLIDDAGTHIAPVLSQPRTVIITDTNVAPLYLRRLEAALDSAGIAHQAIVLPPGEATKSFARFEDLVDQILALNVERKTSLIALGGGVIGDITGFAASVILRGMPFVQIPTTLLAQVDSSVGGKTGINSVHGKNLIGSFHQPRLVLCDTGALDTLDRRQLLAGYAEVVKYGLIADPAFFSWLDENAAKLIDGDPAARLHAVRVSCAAKAGIVARDERENGVRALLNLGHTFGHALEAQTGYGGALLHGEAVAIGMVLAFETSVRLGLCARAEAQKVRSHLMRAGLTVGPSALNTAGWTGEQLLAHMAKDKKVADGKITFVLASAVGTGLLSDKVPLDTVRALWDDWLKGGELTGGPIENAL